MNFERSSEKEEDARLGALPNADHVLDPYSIYLPR
jgi:hypothetical protein